MALFRFQLYGGLAIVIALLFELGHQSMGRKSMLVQTVIGDWHALRSTLLGRLGAARSMPLARSVYERMATSSKSRCRYGCDLPRHVAGAHGSRAVYAIGEVCLRADGDEQIVRV